MTFHTPAQLLQQLEQWQTTATPLSMAQALTPLTLQHGMRRVLVLPYGATVMQLELQTDEADADSFQPLTLAYATPLQYLQDPFALGVTVGRFANRIAGARYTDPTGQTHLLDASQPPHCLHGGRQGFGKKIWQVLEQRADFALLYLDSPAGDQGFPGRLQVFLQLWLQGERLCQRFQAISDALTVVNLTNHCYFNLNGDTDVSRHQLQVQADAMLLVDDSGIPIAEPLRFVGAAALPSTDCDTPCTAAPLSLGPVRPSLEYAPSSLAPAAPATSALQALCDLRQPTPLDGRFARVDHGPQALLTHGLDHCFITGAGSPSPRQVLPDTAASTSNFDAEATDAAERGLAAEQAAVSQQQSPEHAAASQQQPAVHADLSKPLPLQARLTAPLGAVAQSANLAAIPPRQRVLEVYSSQPGLQVYRGNYLSAPFTPYQAVCLEAQNWPDAPNRADFPASWLAAGQWYQQQIDYRFFDEALG